MINYEQENPLSLKTLLSKLRWDKTSASGVIFVAACLLSLARPLAAQDNYEIQVYGSETVAPKDDHAGIAQ